MSRIGSFGSATWSQGALSSLHPSELDCRFSQNLCNCSIASCNCYQVGKKVATVVGTAAGFGIDSALTITITWVIFHYATEISVAYISRSGL